MEYIVEIIFSIIGLAAVAATIMFFWKFGHAGPWSTLYERFPFDTTCRSSATREVVFFKADDRWIGFSYFAICVEDNQLILIAPYFLRWLIPTVGIPVSRFSNEGFEHIWLISEDPIGFEGGDVNLYAYAGGNPIMVVDPLGLAGSCASVDCIIYGGTQPANVGGPSLRELNETTPGEVATGLGVISLATGTGAAVLGAEYLSKIAIFTGVAAAFAVPSVENISQAGVSLVSRGLIRPTLGDLPADAIDSYNLLFQAGSLARPRYPKP